MISAIIRGREAKNKGLRLEFKLRNIKDMWQLYDAFWAGSLIHGNIIMSQPFDTIDADVFGRAIEGDINGKQDETLRHLRVRKDEPEICKYGGCVK